MTQATARSEVDGVNLDAVAAAVRACPGVDDLDGGPVSARLATYLPGRKIDGLKVTQDALTVQIRGVWDVPATEVGAQIRFAVSDLAIGRRVDIIIADLTPAPGYEPEPAPAPHPKPPSQPEPAAVQADADEITTPTPVSVTPEIGDETAAPVAGPVVVERTVRVTEKVVHAAAAAEVAALIATTPPAPAPVPTGQSVPEPEGEPEEWVRDKATDDATSSGDVGDASSSARITPTPGQIPPRS